MSLLSLLVRLDAPSKLLVWTARRDEEAAWSQCGRGDWLIWIAACSGLPLRPVLRVACECVLQAVQAMPTGREPLEQAVALARGAPSPKAARLAAKRCEQAARAFPTSYRAAVVPGYRAASRAAAWVARAAAGLATAEVRAATQAAEEARERAIGIGLHPYIMAPKEPGPARIDPSAFVDDPVQEQVAYAVAAIAQALAQAALALAPSAADRPERRVVRASFAESLRQGLADIEPRPG